MVTKGHNATPKSAPATASAKTAPLTASTTNIIQGVAYPKKYFEHKALDLHFHSKSDRSIDELGSQTYKVKQNTPVLYVRELQLDLISLGYLPASGVSSKKQTADGYYCDRTKRAVSRFQRHAARVYRITKGAVACDTTPTQRFTGRTDGVCDYQTAQEIQKWLSMSWQLPLSRFPLQAVASLTTSFGPVKLRSDVAKAWSVVFDTVTKLGGTLDGPYGDALRPTTAVGGAGASRLSFHYAGRAVDINQSLADRNSRQRYFITKDGTGKNGQPLWRIYCKTTAQDGTQGSHKNNGAVQCIDFFDLKDYPIPDGWYIDLTEQISQGGIFERIPAHAGWEKSLPKREWWHFQYALDKQLTFLDEMELIGVGEEELLKKGWTLPQMDSAPG